MFFNLKKRLIKLIPKSVSQYRYFLNLVINCNSKSLSQLNDFNVKCFDYCRGISVFKSVNLKNNRKNKFLPLNNQIKI